MNRILTTPKKIEQNKRVLYTGNHCISLPEIDIADASVKGMNVVSLFNKGLVDLRGEQALFRPEFHRNGKKLLIQSSSAVLEHFYIPVFEFESSEGIDVWLVCCADKLSLLRFNSHDLDFSKEVKLDKWLGNPALNIISSRVSFSIAFGGDNSFSFEEAHRGKLVLKLACKGRNAFYIAVNSDMDGASTTLIHFRRKGFTKIYLEFKAWLM
ncbi:MAG: hypothetical protein ACM3TR_08885 [Caulobacteraceae bacterium]